MLVMILNAVPLVIFLGLLLVIAVMDTKTGTIPDLLNILLALGGILVAYHRGSVDVLALVLGISFLGAQWLLSSGRWIGSGDVFLMVGLGLALPSWEHLVLALALAYVTGACVAIILLVTEHARPAHRIPFGPFLALGGGAALMTGEQIISFLM